MTPTGYVSPNNRGDLRQQHVDVLRTGAALAGDVMGHRQQTHHSRSDDNAITVSAGSLLYSAAYAVVFLVVMLLLAWLAWQKLDADPTVMFALAGITWGCITYYFLGENREHGLRHSTAGIALAEIASREDVAHHAIDAHLEIVKLQLGMTDEHTPAITVRRRLHTDA